MTNDDERAETEALVEAGGELLERIRRGEDVDADLRAWSMRVDSITGRRSNRLPAKIERPGVHVQVKIKVLIRARGEHDT